MKIGSIVIRCYEFDRMLAFWQDALHYVPYRLIRRTRAGLCSAVYMMVGLSWAR